LAGLFFPFPFPEVKWGPGLTVGDPGGDKGANTKHELLQGCDATPNARVAEFSLVQWNNHGEKADTTQNDQRHKKSKINRRIDSGCCLPDASKASTRVHVADVLRTGLQAATEEENEGADEDGHFTTEVVANGAGKHCAEKSTPSKD